MRGQTGRGGETATAMGASMPVDFPIGSFHSFGVAAPDRPASAATPTRCVPAAGFDTPSHESQPPALRCASQPALRGAICAPEKAQCDAWGRRVVPIMRVVVANGPLEDRVSLLVPNSGTRLLDLHDYYNHTVVRSRHFFIGLLVLCQVQKVG